jgi:hypothetical protein
MWKYVQSTGDLFDASGKNIARGYSGKNPEGINQPDKECEANVGPIPRGLYDIGRQKDKPTPVTLPLTARDPNHCSPPRSGFLIHGDNSSGTASTGCIVVGRTIRETIRDSGDTTVQVVRASSLKRNRRIRPIRPKKRGATVS